MGYKNLIKFKSILESEEFDYISNHKNIKIIEDIISNGVLYSNGLESDYSKLLNIFLGNLNVFYNSIQGINVPDIRKGYLLSSEELQRAINLLLEPESKRNNLSRVYYRQFSKKFLSGLSELLSGIRVAFDPEIISFTKINTNQLIRYILNDAEGLGKFFLFNRTGRHAFLNKINQLNKQELITTIKLLTRPSKSQIRFINGWRDLARGGAPVRILSEHRLFRKDKVYFLYKVNEHSPYEAQLNITPDKSPFSP
ncbi:MAG: hypothetical protein WC755_00650 [Candidatus Woesearchaeota archaeon]